MTASQTPDSRETIPELTFEQQQEISRRLEGYRTNPSNSNKYRYDLFAYIDEVLTAATLAAQISEAHFFDKLLKNPEVDLEELKTHYQIRQRNLERQQLGKEGAE